MKCSICGNENDSNELKCSFCEKYVTNSKTNITKNVLTQDDIYSFFVKKIINGKGVEILESPEIGLKLTESGKVFNYFLSYSIENKNEHFLELFAEVNSKEFLLDGRFNHINIKIIFNNYEDINFKIDYSSYSEDNQRNKNDWGTYYKVLFRIPFTKDLLYNLIKSENVILEIKQGGRSMPDILNLPKQVIIIFSGFYNFVYSESINAEIVYDYGSNKIKENIIKKNGWLQILNIYPDFEIAYKTLDHLDFKEWIKKNELSINNYLEKNNKDLKNESESRKVDTEELKKKERSLREWDSNDETRMGLNAFLSIALLIFIWLKFDLKIAIFIIIIYNLFFFVYSKNKVFQLKKRIEELKNLIK